MACTASTHYAVAERHYSGGGVDGVDSMKVPSVTATLIWSVCQEVDSRPVDEPVRDVSNTYTADTQELIVDLQQLIDERTRIGWTLNKNRRDTAWHYAATGPQLSKDDIDRIKGYLVNSASPPPSTELVQHKSRHVKIPKF